MTLSEIRQQFVEVSGRYDLNEVPKDTTLYRFKADFFIQAAVRWLDRKQQTQRSVSRYCVDLAAGGFKVLVPEARSIHNVYAQYSDENIVELEKLEYKDLREQYTKSLSKIDREIPRYWIVSPHVLAADQESLMDYSSVYTYEFGDTVFAGSSTPGDVGRYRVQELILVPPTDRLITITAVGEFFSKYLYEDSDTNYWTEQEPDLLIEAALRKLEGFYRNTEGVRDMDYLIEADRFGIEADLIEQESHGITKMRG